MVMSFVIKNRIASVFITGRQRSAVSMASEKHFLESV